VLVPIAQAPAAVDASLGFEMVIATTPIETKFCPHAELDVPNLPAFAAGAEVEFWLHGDSLEREWAPYGGWAKVSSGSVSADGTRIVTRDGEGVPLLGVFAIKLP
jgi:hypothetical protein